MKQYDTVIIGAGVTGCAIARELSRRKGRFLVVERALDVCEGTSKANSAIIHAGFDAEPGTLKAKMNVLGNQKMDQLSQELDIPFQRIGALVVCLDPAELPQLRALYDRGLANGVAGLSLLSGEEARALEPNLAEGVCGALLASANFVKLLAVDRWLMHNTDVTIVVALVICLTLVCTVFCAKVVGCLLPLLAEKIGLDPAVMAAPFISTIVDVLSLLIYFQFAMLLLGL